MEDQPPDSGPDRKIFLFLIAYRWASLLPALWLFLRPGAAAVERLALPALFLAAGNALLISIFHRALNRHLLRRPVLLVVDLAFTAGLLAISGGAHSPYYLYALSPLLAGAFFFQIRGAVICSAVYTILYLLALGASGRIDGRPPDSNQLFIQLAGIWLIPILFSYPSLLLSQLRRARDDLSAARDDLAEQNLELHRMNRQLEIIHDLVMILQAAPDLHTVQRRVLEAVTEELGFPSSAVGLFDPDSEELGDWQVYSPGDLSQNLSSALEQEDPMRLMPPEKEPSLLVDRDLLGWEVEIAGGRWLSVPLRLREHPVGLLLVGLDSSPHLLSSSHREMLRVIASQAAVALGTTMVCIDRAQRLAVEQERNRIARDIHDTVAQSLFGIVFSLDACAAMLPEKGEQVRQELIELRQLASEVRDEVRRSVFDLWPAELTLERFESDLVSSVSQCCHPRTFKVDFTTSGDFDRLSPIVRRTLFRIAQEALTNAAKHSGADCAQVCLGIEGKQVHLCVRDGGRGFDPGSFLFRDQEEGHFGLKGMQQRILALGGESEIYSRETQGTMILASLPIQPGGLGGA